MFLWTFICLLHLPILATSHGDSNHPLLLLISFDGWRYDLLSESTTPTLWKFAKSGVHFTNGVKSQYLTVTAANHMSMATGLWQESHGIVGNQFYDPQLNARYDLFNLAGNSTIAQDSLSERWYKGEPIWLTNERAGGGRTSGAMHWPACDATFAGFPSHPSLSKPYLTMDSGQASWNRDVDAIMEWFTREEKEANFVAWYVEDPDHELHENGFNSTLLSATLKALDNSFGHMLQRVTQLGLNDRLNIIVTADHGHVQIAKYEQLICISEYVNVAADGVHTGDHMLYIQNSTVSEQYYTLLTAAVAEHGLGMKVYRKTDFPDLFHYKNTPRVGDIILLPDAGWSVSFDCTYASMDEQFKANPSSFSKSTHGQDPGLWQMRAALAMRGPAFEAGLNIEGIPSNVDLYPLMCHVLDVRCAPNNGSLSIIGQALRESSSIIGHRLDYLFDKHGSLLSFRFFVLLCSVVVPVLMFVVYAWLSFRRSSPNHPSLKQGYSRLNNESSPADSSTLMNSPAVKNSLMGDADSMSEDDL